MSEASESTFGYRLARDLLRIGLTLYNRMSSHGAQNVPRTGGCIIAANHVSYLDPPIMGSGMRHRVVRFMARDTLFKPGLAHWVLSRVSVIPISRERGDVGALRKAIQLLRQGECIGLFPEGTRSPDGELHEPKGGIGFLIAKAKVPVVPTYIAGSYRAFPKGAKWIKPCKVRVFYGTPISPEELDAIPESDDRYDKIGRLVMDRIRAVRDGVMPVRAA